MGTPDETTVWIGLDIGKTEHFADVLDEAGSPLFARAVANDEAAIEVLRLPGAGRRLAASATRASCAPVRRASASTSQLRVLNGSKPSIGRAYATAGN